MTAAIPAATVEAVRRAERHTDPGTPLLIVTQQIAQETRVPAGTVAAVLLQPDTNGGAQ